MLALLVSVSVAASPAPPRTPLAPQGATEKDDSAWARDEQLLPKRQKLTPDEIWNEPSTPTEPPGTLSQPRLLRFVGAFVGGAVGLGVPLLLLPLADAPCALVSGAFSFCPTPVHFLVGTLSLIGAIAGAAGGFAVAGGEVSGGAVVAGTFVGLFLALAVAAVAVAVSQPFGGMGLGLPVVVAGAGLVVGSQALAMLLRDDAREGRPWLSSSGGRIALTSLTFLGTVGVGALLTALLGAATQSGVVAIGAGVIFGSLVPLAVWGTHRALDGKGSIGIAYLATLATAALGFLGAGFFAITNGSFLVSDGGRIRGAATTAVVVGGVLLATLGVPLILEASHGGALIEEREPKVALSLGGAPVAGGAMGVVTGRF
jgi:hypothetical protein